MTTIPNRPDLTFYQRVAVLLTLCALSGCEAFLVSICELQDLPTCKIPADGSSPKADLTQGTDDGGGQVPAIEERQFIHRASRLIDSKHQFTGMLNGNLITLSINNLILSWEAWRSDLNNLDEGKRLISTGTGECPNFPPSFIFGSDDIYIVGREFYYFQRSGGQNLFKLDKVSNSIFKVLDNKLNKSDQPRAFTHPSISALAIAMVPASPATNSTLIRLESNTTFQSDAEKMPTAFVIGDLDSNDLQNGQEIIIFDGGKPKSLFHWNPGISFDKGDIDLMSALSQAIERTALSDTSPIEAAFIANLNYDNFPDFIYTRNGIIYVTSYLGRDKATPPNFRDWMTKIPAILGEKIKSLVAVELTNDTYPELVVETDKAVHFYVNTPR